MTEATNYAKHRKTRELVFFDGDIPARVRAEPLEWVTWLKTTVPGVGRIGENPK